MWHQVRDPDYSVGQKSITVSAIFVQCRTRRAGAIYKVVELKGRVCSDSLVRIELSLTLCNNNYNK